MTATKNYTVTMYTVNKGVQPTWSCTANSMKDAVQQFRAAKSANPKSFPPAMRCFVRMDGGKRSYDVDGI